MSQSSQSFKERKSFGKCICELRCFCVTVTLFPNTNVDHISMELIILSSSGKKTGLRGNYEAIPGQNSRKFSNVFSGFSLNIRSLIVHVLKIGFAKFRCHNMSLFRSPLWLCTLFTVQHMAV